MSDSADSYAREIKKGNEKKMYNHSSAVLRLALHTHTAMLLIIICTDKLFSHKPDGASHDTRGIMYRGIALSVFCTPPYPPRAARSLLL